MSDALKKVLVISAILFGVALAAVLKFSAGLSDLSAVAFGFGAAVSELVVLSFLFRRMPPPRKDPNRSGPS